MDSVAVVTSGLAGELAWTEWRHFSAQCKFRDSKMSFLFKNEKITGWGAMFFCFVLLTCSLFKKKKMTDFILLSYIRPTCLLPLHSSTDHDPTWNNNGRQLSVHGSIRGRLHDRCQSLSRSR